MPETFHVDEFNYKGQKDNPHGGVLHKFYVSLTDEGGTQHQDVYWQRKSPGLNEGTEVYGHIEDGEYGPRFKTDPRPDGSGNQGSSGGNFQTPANLKPLATRPLTTGPDPQAERSRRIERQHSQEMALRALRYIKPIPDLTTDGLEGLLRYWTDFFVQDLDADLGGGGSYPEPVKATADVSAGPGRTVLGTGQVPVDVDLSAVEASPAQKGKLTNLFGKAGLSRDAMKAVVLYRCRSEKATKDGASKLIQDLMDGATHDTLLAEIHDAKRAGDPLAVRAAKLIPPDVPLAKDPNEKAQEYEDESGVPF